MRDEQVRGKLTFTVATARAGKSTFAAKWREGGPNRVVISGDSFRKALTGFSFLPLAEPFVFATLDTAVRALLNDGYDVLIDETATTEATILRYLHIDLDATPVFIDTPVDECIHRAMVTGQEHLVGPIQRMAGQLEQLKSDWDAKFQRLKQQVIIRKSHDHVVK